MKKNIARWLVAVLFAVACQPPTPPENQFEKLANGFCECTQTLAEINQALQKKGGAATVQPENLEKIDSIFQTTKACAATLVGQFGKLRTDDFEKIKPFLLKKCPDRAANTDLLRELIGE